MISYLSNWFSACVMLLLILRVSSYRFSDMPKLENSGVYSTEKPVFEDMHFLLKLMGHRQAVIQIVTIKE